MKVFFLVGILLLFSISTVSADLYIIRENELEVLTPTSMSNSAKVFYMNIGGEISVEDQILFRTGLNVTNISHRDFKNNNIVNKLETRNKTLNGSIQFYSDPFYLYFTPGDWYWRQTTFTANVEELNSTGVYRIEHRVGTPGPFNESKIILKIPLTDAPLKTPVILNTIPTPDAIYDTANHKVLLWEPKTQDVKNGEERLFVIVVEYSYVEDRNTKLNFSLLVIGFFLGLVGEIILDRVKSHRKSTSSSS